MKIIEKIKNLRSNRKLKKGCEPGLKMLDEFFTQLEAK